MTQSKALVGQAITLGRQMATRRVSGDEHVKNAA